SLFYFKPLDADAVRHVPPRRLGRPHDLDDVADLEAVVARDRVRALDARQLLRPELVAVQERLPVLGRQEGVRRHEAVLGHVDQQLGVAEVLDQVRGGHLLERGLGEGRDALLHHEDRVAHARLLHHLAVLLDGLDAHLVVVRQEDEELVLGVGLVLREDRQVVPLRLVAELVHEAPRRHGELRRVDDVRPLLEHLEQRPPDAEEVRGLARERRALLEGGHRL
ncbi:unnamed protein product, partial [Pelagomonas calceolata]